MLWLLWDLIEDGRRCWGCNWWLCISWLQLLLFINDSWWYWDFPPTTTRRWGRRQLTGLSSHLVLYTTEYVQVIHWCRVIVFNFGLNDIRCVHIAANEFTDWCRRRCSVFVCSHYHTDSLSFQRSSAIRWRWVIGATWTQILRRRSEWWHLFGKVAWDTSVHSLTWWQIRVIFTVGWIWCHQTFRQIDWLQFSF